jgi:hypothetical protein
MGATQHQSAPMIDPLLLLLLERYPECPEVFIRDRADPNKRAIGLLYEFDENLVPKNARESDGEYILNLFLHRAGATATLVAYYSNEEVATIEFTQHPTLENIVDWITLEISKIPT